MCVTCFSSHASTPPPPHLTGGLYGCKTRKERLAPFFLCFFFPSHTNTSSLPLSISPHFIRRILRLRDKRRTAPFGWLLASIHILQLGLYKIFVCIFGDRALRERTQSLTFLYIHMSSGGLTRLLHLPPSFVGGVRLRGWGVVRVVCVCVCVCVGVGVVVLCRCVCVCDLLIFLLHTSSGGLYGCETREERFCPAGCWREARRRRRRDAICARGDAG